jgi:hypothetical protein
MTHDLRTEQSITISAPIASAGHHVAIVAGLAHPDFLAEVEAAAGAETNAA